MVTAILLFGAFVTLAILLGAYSSQSVYKNGMIFAVRIPKEAAEHEIVGRIRHRFRKEMRTTTLLTIGFLIPAVFLRESFLVLYFLAWMTATVAVTALPFRRAHRDTLAAKRANDWSAGLRADEDEYWGNGFTYHNPHDRRVFVEKRVGIGMTVNTGTPAGKWFMGIAIGITAAVVIGVSFLLLRSELTSPQLNITEERRIDIDYPMYSYEVPAESIVDIALAEEIPRGIKTNGEATERVARGHFKLNDLGKARLYVFKKNPPYIRMRLKEGGYIFYNEEDPRQTEQVYERLRQMMDSVRQ